MFDIITIGAATKDVFLVNKNFAFVRSKRFSTGVGECFAFGSKVDIQELYEDTGGGATNAAATFRNLGLATAVIARVGEDDDGRTILSDLAERKIDTSFVVTDRHVHTGYSTILLARGGERTILVYRGASAHFNVQEIPWHRLYTKWFYLSSIGGNARVLKAFFVDAEKRAARIAWNPGGGELKLGLRRLLPYIAMTDVLILNREEAAQLTKGKSILSILKTLGALVRGVAAITDSKRGAYLCAGRECWYAPAYGKRVVNATGAGDAFGSALTAGIAQGLTSKEALRLAIMNSGFVVSKMGAKHGLLESMPTLGVLKRVRVVKLG